MNVNITFVCKLYRATLMVQQEAGVNLLISLIFFSFNTFLKKIKSRIQLKTKRDTAINTIDMQAFSEIMTSLKVLRESEHNFFNNKKDKKAIIRIISVKEIMCPFRDLCDPTAQCSSSIDVSTKGDGRTV